MTPKPIKSPAWLHTDDGGPGVSPEAVAIHKRLCDALAAGRWLEAADLMAKLNLIIERAGNHPHNTHNSKADGG